MRTQISQDIISRAIEWLGEYFDDYTKAEIKRMLEKDHEELIEAFYRDLDFGTGGLRGIIGIGTNRMNRYTVGMSTQGLANYLNKININNDILKVAIAYDSRNKSKEFAEITAEVLSANGIKVFIFDKLRPIALLSFAIRYLKCNAGVVITASHNPKEYNGYKVYWSDGAQLIAPHDKNIINEIKNIKISDVKFNKNYNLISIINEEIDNAYLQKVKELSLEPDIIKKYHNICIVYSALHGSGTNIIPKALEMYGFTNVNIVPEQSQPDGNFPTVKSPNPEEPSAMQMAIQLAQKLNANLVIATDPDADRVGVGIKDNANNYILLNGNQTASIIIYYLLKKYKEKLLLTPQHYIVKTIVTTDLLKEMANKAGIICYEVLTGFKYIANIINKFEGKKFFIGGGEESYGYLIGDFVRDKDAIISCCIIAEIAAWAKSQNISMYELLINIYKEYGFYYEKLISIEKKGKKGLEEIATMMNNFRTNIPKILNGSRIIGIKDYKTSIYTNLLNNEEQIIDLPKSDVIQWLLEDETKITIRPSGTEPKIKFYFGIKTDFNNQTNIEDLIIILNERVTKIAKELNILN